MSERSFTAASFQAYLDEGRLMGSRCRDTGEVFIPPRPMCPRTYSENMEWVELSGRARLITFTAVYIGTTAMVEAGYDRKRPYCAGIVELEEGPRFSAQIVDVDADRPESIHVGLPVQAAFVSRGEDESRHNHLVFRPVAQGSNGG